MVSVGVSLEGSSSRHGWTSATRAYEYTRVPHLLGMSPIRERMRSTGRLKRPYREGARNQ